MSAGTVTAYRSRFAGWIAPAGSLKSHEVKPFTGVGAYLPGKHIVSKIASC